MMGQLRDTMVLMDDERERVAYHESGHALLAYVLDKTDPLHKITIIPRGMALGVTMTLPEEDRHIVARQYLEDSLCMRMAVAWPSSSSTATCPPAPPTTSSEYELASAWS